jgi:hypothetical protein
MVTFRTVFNYDAVLVVVARDADEIKFFFSFLA